MSTDPRVLSPRHVAIIMDGNGRWAKQQNKPRIFGHRQGATSIRYAMEAATESDVQILTLYAFSEENWGRPQDEVDGIFSLLEEYVRKEKQTLAEKNVRFRALGQLERLPLRTLQLVQQVERDLAGNNGLQLNIALSYGSRSEIVLACQKLAKQVISGAVVPEKITAEMFAQELWTAGIPDPDLLIRTSGEHRISNFLLWQIAYTELWFTKAYWPDFTKGHFFDAIHDYQQRRRRFGLTQEQCSAENLFTVQV